MNETATYATRRFASLLLLLIGAALLVIGNTTHPVDTDPTATSRLDLATAGSWMAIHLTITLGVLAVVGGLAMLPRAITHPLGSAYARLGAVAAVVGGTILAVVFGALDGYGQATLAAEAQRSSVVESETIETVALAVALALALEIIDSGMTAIGILALFGVAMASFGTALVISRIVARWLGWAALLIGLAGTVSGLLFAVLGPTALVINGLFRPVAMAATLYFVVLAIALRRVPAAIPAVHHDVADPSPRQRPETEATGSHPG